MSSLYQMIADLLVTEFEIERNKLHPEVSFGDLGFDSLARINLALALEEKLNVEIDDEVVSQQKTVRDLVEMLESQGMEARRDAR